MCHSTLLIALDVGSLCCSGMHMVVWTAASVCSVILPFHDHGLWFHGVLMLVNTRSTSP